ncbi:O-antigen ligase family protein [Microbacterium aurantiacum]|uniref:O-antigen ligase family protein n=1 Tax=Microbacterium aurantiacum TaxID=162393 RepID=UPI003D70F99E
MAEPTLPAHRRKRVGQVRTWHSARYAGLFIFALVSLEFQTLGLFSRTWTIVAIVLAAAATVILALSARHRSIPPIRLNGADFAFLLFSAFAALSVTWSVSPASSATQAAVGLFMWISFLGARRVPSLELVRALVIAGVVVAVVSFAVAVFFPSVGLQPNPSAGVPELRGILEHQLRLGLLEASVLAIVIVAYLNGQQFEVLTSSRNKNRVIIVILILGSIAPVARLYSVTVVLALAIAVVLWGARRWRSLFIFVFVAVASTLAFFWQDLIDRLDTIDGGATLSGRTNTWERAIRLAEASPSEGYGYSTFDSPLFDGIFTTTYRPQHAHNSFIQTYFELEWPGLLLLVTMVLIMVRVCVKSHQALNRIPYSGLLVLIVIMASLTGHSLAGTPTTAMWLAFVLLAAEANEAAALRRGVSHSRYDRRRSLHSDHGPRVNGASRFTA